MKRGPEVPSKPSQIGNAAQQPNYIAQIMSGWRAPEAGQPSKAYTDGDYKTIATGLFATVPPKEFYKQLSDAFNALEDDLEKKQFLRNAQKFIKEMVKADINGSYESSHMAGLVNFTTKAIHRKENPETPEFIAIAQQMTQGITNTIIEVKDTKKHRDAQVSGNSGKSKSDPRSIAADLKQHNINIFSNLDLQEVQANFKTGTKPVSDNFNAIGLKVALEVLTAQDAVEKTKIYAKYVNVANECLKIGDYESASAIISGLGKPQIDRLKIKDGLKAKDKEKLDNAIATLEPRANYTQYRAKVLNEQNNNRTFIPLSAVIARENDGGSNNPRYLDDARTQVNGSRIEVDGAVYQALIAPTSSTRQAHSFKSNFISELGNQPTINSDIADHVLYDLSYKAKNPPVIDGVDEHKPLIPKNFQGDLFELMQQEEIKRNEAVAVQADPVPPPPVSASSSNTGEEEEEKANDAEPVLLEPIAQAAPPQQPTAAAGPSTVEENVDKRGRKKITKDGGPDPMAAQQQAAPAAAQATPVDGALDDKGKAEEKANDAAPLMEPVEQAAAAPQIVQPIAPVPVVGPNQPQQIGDFKPFAGEDNAIKQALSGWMQDPDDVNNNKFKMSDYKSLAIIIPTMQSPTEVMDTISSMLRDNPGYEERILVNAKLMLTEIIQAHPESYQELTEYLTADPKPAVDPETIAGKFSAIVKIDGNDSPGVAQRKSNLEAQLTVFAKEALSEKKVDPDIILNSEQAAPFDMSTYIHADLTAKTANRNISEHAAMVAQDLKNHALALLIKIKPNEIMNYDDKKKQDDPSCINVSNLTIYGNKITEMAKSDILRATSKEHQQNIYNFYVTLMNECVKAGDLHTAVSIKGAFDATPISRLKYLGENAYKTMPREYQKMEENFVMMGQEHNFIGMREKKDTIVPYTGIIMKDIIILNGIPSTLSHETPPAPGAGVEDNAAIECPNFFQLGKKGQVMNSLAQYQQQAKENLQSVKFNTQIGLRLSEIHYDENQSYTESQVILPRSAAAAGNAKKAAPFKDTTADNQRARFEEYKAQRQAAQAQAAAAAEAAAQEQPAAAQQQPAAPAQQQPVAAAQPAAPSVQEDKGKKPAAGNENEELKSAEPVKARKIKIPKRVEGQPSGPAPLPPSSSNGPVVQQVADEAPKRKTVRFADEVKSQDAAPPIPPPPSNREKVKALSKAYKASRKAEQSQIQPQPPAPLQPTAASVAAGLDPIINDAKQTDAKNKAESILNGLSKINAPEVKVNDTGKIEFTVNGVRNSKALQKTLKEAGIECQVTKGKGGTTFSFDAEKLNALSLKNVQDIVKATRKEYKELTILQKEKRKAAVVPEEPQTAPPVPPQPSQNARAEEAKQIAAALKEKAPPPPPPVVKADTPAASPPQAAASSVPVDASRLASMLNDPMPDSNISAKPLALETTVEKPKGFGEPTRRAHIRQAATNIGGHDEVKEGGAYKPPVVSNFQLAREYWKKQAGEGSKPAAEDNAVKATTKPTHK